MFIILQCSIVYGDIINIPEDIKTRLSQKTWTCDENKVIPVNYVNDNFCDCEDGTDEFLTNACYNGFIYCINPHNNTEYCI